MKIMVKEGGSSLGSMSSERQAVELSWCFAFVWSLDVSFVGPSLSSVIRQAKDISATVRREAGEAVAENECYQKSQCLNL